MHFPIVNHHLEFFPWFLWVTDAVAWEEIFHKTVFIQYHLLPDFPFFYAALSAKGVTEVSRPLHDRFEMG